MTATILLWGAFFCNNKSFLSCTARCVFRFLLFSVDMTVLTWWAATPGHRGVICNRGSCWMNRAPEKLQVWCCTPSPQGRISPSYGNLKETKESLSSSQSQSASTAFHAGLIQRLGKCCVICISVIWSSYLPLCYHSLKQTDKLKERKESVIHLLLF